MIGLLSIKLDEMVFIKSGLNVEQQSIRASRYQIACFTIYRNASPRERVNVDETLYKFLPSQDRRVCVGVLLQDFVLDFGPEAKLIQVVRSLVIVLHPRRELATVVLSTDATL